MNKRLYPLVVLRDYSDQLYQRFLRQAFAEEKSKFNGGRLPFYERLMKPMIIENLSQIALDDGSPFHPDFLQIDSDLKLITDFLRPKYLNRKFNNGFLRIVDAFLQIKKPGFNAAFSQRSNKEAIGLAVGSFLRDESAFFDRQKLALNTQSIVGLYRYEERNTHQMPTGDMRYVGLFSGENLDYLHLVDVKQNREKIGTRYQSDENLEILSGFCIPGETFSLVINRSARLRYRQIGILYSPGNLINLAGELFENLSYEIFTTESQKKFDVPENEKTSSSLSLSKLMDVHFGPRIRCKLEFVKGDEEKELKRNIFDNISIDML